MADIIKDSVVLGFTIDKTFNNKVAMEDDKSIYPGRFVMIKYCESALDYKTRQDLEKGSSAKDDQQKSYQSNYTIDEKANYTKSYDRYVFKRTIDGYEEICCLHPMDNSSYSDAVINAENLNLENGSENNSLEQKGGAIASGAGSFAANTAKASGNLSAAFGINTSASGTGQFAVGQYNADDPRAAFIVGTGSDDKNRNNAFAVYKTGGVSVGDIETVVGYNVSELEQNYSSWDTSITVQGISSDIKADSDSYIAWVKNNGVVRFCTVYLIEENISSRNLIVKGDISENDHIIFIEKCPGGKDYLSLIADDSLSVGSGNIVKGNNSLAIGKSNSIKGNVNFLAGEGNNLKSNYSFALGKNNKDMSTSTAISVLLGENLQSYDTYSQVVVGTCNKSIDANFIVGTGSSDSDRKNSFVVRGSGVFAPRLTEEDFYCDPGPIVGVPLDSLLVTRRMLIDIAHPVGSYYWSSDLKNPSELFPGTSWEQIKDKFVFAAGSKAVDETGGSETVKLTINEMPNHSHGFSVGEDGKPFVVPAKIGSGGLSDIRPENVGEHTTQSHWANQVWGTTSTGGSQSHNNMPPYIVAYCWRRES